MTSNETDLVITRLIRAKRANVWKAWTDPEHLKEWWCPKPWITTVRGFDLRAGGVFDTYMQGPDGGESSNPGLFLEVVPLERVVFTSALVEGWRPGTPWMSFTAIITMADEDGGTRYVARVMHKDIEEARKHEELGFFDGWNTCITQLEAYANTLR